MIDWILGVLLFNSLLDQRYTVEILPIRRQTLNNQSVFPLENILLIWSRNRFCWRAIKFRHLLVAYFYLFEPHQPCQEVQVFSSSELFWSPIVRHFHHIFIFSRATGPISIKLGTNGIQVCSNEEPRPFARGDNHEIAKKHWRN